VSLLVLLPLSLMLNWRLALLLIVLCVVFAGLTALVLRKAEAGEGPRVERLKGIDAVEMLVANTYRGAYLETIGRTGEHLAACVRIARTVPVFSASRRWGFDRFDEEAAALRDHALAQRSPL